MPSDIQCKVIRTTPELEAFVPEWTALWRCDPHATPFQSPEWLLPWWHQFGQLELRAIAIWQNGRLIGFLPFYIYPNPSTHERQLLLLGVGTSDYLDGTFSSDCTTLHVQAALDLLLAEGGWDTLSVSQMRPESILWQAFRLRDHPAVQQFESASCSRMPAVQLAQLPVKIRRNAMYYRNRALRLGALQLVSADSSNWSATLDALEGLHTERWESCGETGIFADRRVLAWHREAIPRLQQSGMLRLSSLRLNGEIIGVLYSLIDPVFRPARTQYVYLPAFSIKHAELRPGTLLLALAVDHAANEGVETIDMLRGDEEYKKVWHVRPVPTYGFCRRRETPQRIFASSAR